MKMCGLISADEQGEVRSGEARFFLNALFVAGMEEQKHQQSVNNNCQRGVVIYNRHWEKLDEFGSVTEAAEKTGVYKDSISRLLSNRRLSRKGFYYRHADDDDIMRSTVDQGGDGE